MYKVLLLSVQIIVALSFYAQKITGELTAHVHQQVKLYKYEGITSLLVDSAIVDKAGFFELKLPKDFKGMGYLKTSDNSYLNLILDQKKINLEGVHLKEPSTIRFGKSKENQLYNRYSIENPQREGVLAGWKYLLQQYQNNPLFENNKEEVEIIKEYIEKVEGEDERYVESLNKKTYTRYILPIQKLVRDVPMSAKHYTERIPQNINDFRQLDYTDPRLYNSGLLDDALQAHYWLIENSGLPLDSVFTEMNISTDYLLENLANNEEVLNIATDYLFDLLEKHSLFKASEYLALKVLTQNSCTLNDDLANQLETYRAMKIGNKASDISFSGLTLKQGVELPKSLKLSNLQTNYKLVMFGASWCPKCTEELPKVKTLYQKWLQKGVDVVLVALDNNKEDYLKFVADFPWLSTCDFKQWDSQAAKDYYVFSTPTLFLLDKNNTIVLRPNSIKQVDAWVDFNIK